MKDIQGRHQIEFIHHNYEELETNQGNYEEKPKKDNIFVIFFCCIISCWYRWRHNIQLDVHNW